jgi:thioredoxin-like negative regulator of GroEL
MAEINSIALASLAKYSSAAEAGKIYTLYEKVTKELEEQGDKISEKDRKEKQARLKSAENMIKKGDLKGAEKILKSILAETEKPNLEVLDTMISLKNEEKSNKLKSLFGDNPSINEAV